MDPTSSQVLKLLASGECLSGESIGRQLGISRMAVSKAVRRLVEHGIHITSRPGKGYTLEQWVQPLDAQAIEKDLRECGRSECQLHILESTESTSDYLLALDPADISGAVCLAERQLAGRGRRKRGWVATPYRNITMSLAWRFDHGMADLAGLGVAAGIAIVKSLHEYGLDSDIGLKWPNDIVWHGRKLGGMLIDVRGEHDGPCLAVLGLGLNLSLSEADTQAIDQPCVDLEEIEGGHADRNAIVAALIAGLTGMFKGYSDCGLEPWHGLWPQYDRLLNEEVVIIRGEDAMEATALGIDRDGALVARLTSGEPARFFSAEVSLRKC